MRHYWGFQRGAAPLAAGGVQHNVATFIYKAMRAGAQVTGEVSAPDRRAALLAVRKKGLTPVSVQEAGASGSPGLFSRKGRIPQREITKAVRQLATLLISGLPLAKCLGLLRDQAASAALREVVADLEVKLRSGATFSEALAAHPAHFDQLFQSMVKAGEAGGVLAGAVERLAGMREASEELRAKVKGAMIYPSFMLIAMSGAVAILVVFVVPRFAGLFADMGQALPLPTQMLLSLAQALKAVWWLFPAVAGAAWFGFQRYRATPGGALALDRFKLRLPLAGGVLQGVSLARVCRTLGTLLDSGVPLLTALAAAGDVSGNQVIRQAVNKSMASVREGKKLGETLAASGAFSRYVVEMASVGEESGSLGAMMLRVAETYERDTDRLVKDLTALVEPLMILVMGGVVAFIVLAMLLPIFQMNLMAG
jgi:type II secretory pathway component PulF